MVKDHQAELELLRQLVAEAYPLVHRIAGKHGLKARMTRHNERWHSYHERREAAVNTWLDRATDYRPIAMTRSEVA